MFGVLTFVLSVAIVMALLLAIVKAHLVDESNCRNTWWLYDDGTCPGPCGAPPPCTRGGDDASTR